MSKNWIDTLSPQASSKLCSKRGETIIRPGDHFDPLFICSNSCIRAYMISQNGEETTLHIFSPSTFFAYCFCSGNSKSHLYFEVMEADTIQSIDRKTASAIITKDEPLFAMLMSLYVHALQEFETSSSIVMTGPADRRIASVLLGLSKQFGIVKKNTTEIKLRITHRILASFTGMARETISVHIARMEKKKILQQRSHHFVIINLDKLKILAEEDSV